MNKLSFRKPLALLLTVVMLMSSMLVYVPAFAAGPFMYEGQEKYLDFAPLSTQKLLLEDEVFSGHWCDNYYWENKNCIEISTTRFLPARSEPYVILVVNDGNNDGEYFKERTVNLSVKPNRAPVTDDELNIPVDEGKSVVIKVLVGDSDPDGDEIDLVSVSPTDTGFEVDGTVVKFTAPVAMDADAEFTAIYTIKDDNVHGSLTATGTIKVQVSEVDDPTIYNDLGVKTSENTPKDFDPLFEVDDEDDTVTVDTVNFSQPDNGTVTYSNSEWTYDPNTDYSGTDTFIVYLLVNGESLPRTVNVEVEDDGVVANLPPTNDDLEIATSENASLSFDPLAGVTDPDDDDDNIVFDHDPSKITDPSHGVAIVDTDDTTKILYTPESDWSGIDEFKVDVTSGEHTVTRTIRISVTNNDPDNAPPTNDDLELATSENASLSFNPLIGVTDSDDDDSSIVFDSTSITSPSHGVADVDSSDATKILYIPTTDWSGVDEFEVDVISGDHTVTRTIRISVTNNDPDNAPPSNDDLEIATSENASLLFNPLAGVTDPDDDDDSIAFDSTSITVPSHGAAVLDIDDPTMILYTPDSDWSGVDEFEVDVTSGDHTVTRTIRVSVTNNDPDNAPPSNDDLEIATSENASLSFDPLAGVTDPDDDDSNIVFVSNSITAPSHGAAVVDTEDSTMILYTPESDWSGVDEFEVDVTSGDHTVTRTIRISVTENDPNNASPIFNSETFTVYKGEVDKVFDWTEYVEEDLDGPNPLSLVGTIVPNVGKIEVGATGFLYTHDGSNPNPDGVHGTLTFTVTDGINETTGNVELIVTTKVYDSLEDIPKGTYKNIPVSVDLSDLTLHDDFDESSLEVIATFEGEATDGFISSDGLIVTYDPNNDIRDTIITYVIKDNFGHVTGGRIIVNVYNYASETMIYINELPTIRINQHSDPERVRDGVICLPSLDAIAAVKLANPTATEEEVLALATEYIYESVNPDSVDYYYNTSARNAEGNPASVVHFFGNFSLTYHMKDTSGQNPVSLGSKNVFVNGRPQLSLSELPNPLYILPEDHTDISLAANTPAQIAVTEEIFFGETFELNKILHGFDWEDYRTNGVLTLFDQPLPETMTLKYYLNGSDEGTEIGTFWDELIVGKLDLDTEDPDDFELPAGAFKSGRGLDGVAYTTYHVQFTLTDSERIACPDGYESEKTDILEVIVYNNDPVINDVEETLIVTVKDILAPMELVTVEDPEDMYLASIGELALPLKEAIEFTVYDESNDAYVDLETVVVNDLGPGVFRFIYTYEDAHGQSTREESLVVILSEPIFILSPQTVEMEPNGWFPVFNGIVFDDDEIDNLLNDADIGYDLDLELAAFIDDDGTLVELDDLTWIEDTVEIIYKLGIDLSYSEMNLAEAEFPEHDLELIYTRDVIVSDEDMGQVIYISDFWKETETVIVEPSEIGDYDDFESFSLLMKLNPETGKKRLVTAVFIDGKYSLSDESISFDKECDVDDIVVTKTGEIYGLRSREFLKLNPLTMRFEEIFDIKDEFYDFVIRHELVDDSNSYSWCLDIQSLTEDERGYLVIAVEEDNLYDAFHSSDERDYGDYDTALLYFNPNGFVPELPLEDPSVAVSEYPELEAELNYLEEVALIDWGMVGENDRVPFDGVTDLAFDEDFEALYGIGNYYYDPADFYKEQVDEPDGESIETESYKSKDGNKYYQIFKLEVDEDTAGLVDAPFVRYFKLTDVEDLEFGYMYRGMAVVGNDIYLTRFMTSCLYDALNEPDETGGRSLAGTTVTDPVEITLMITDVIRYTFSDGFVNQNDIMPVTGMFKAAFGASGMKTEMTISPLVKPISLYNDENATDQTATFTVTKAPIETYEVVEWTILGDGGDYVTNNGNGVFTLKATVTSSMSIQVQAKAMNLYSGNYETQIATIQIDYHIRNTGGDDDDDDDGGTSTSRVAASSVPTVGVKLDTDAITLDYGETADPEFTSYDFTETVTNTSNKDVSWSLSDDTYVTVNNNGVVTAKSDVPVDTGDFTVILTVKTDDGGATATATILFEEQTPLGAIEFFEPYVSGYTDGSFRPSNDVTRAEVASMFARILKLNMVTSGSQKFSDVSSDYWAYGSIQAMYRSGLFSGYLDKDGIRYFDPEEAISRAEIAQVFTNYWNFLEISVTGENLTPIPDVPSDYWASPAINRIFNTGIFTGFDDGTFKPDDSTLREQIVSMINRLIARPANEAETSKFTDILPTHKHFGDIEAASQTFLKSQGE